jgi:hypothetical protein
MQNCTPLYVATVLAHTKLGQQCFTAEELAEACTLATAAHSSQHDLLQALAENSEVLAKFPAWSAEQRPASATQQLELQYKMTMQELKVAVEQHLQDRTELSTLVDQKIWRGARLSIKMSLRTGSGQQSGTDLGMSLFFKGRETAVQRIKYSLKVTAMGPADVPVRRPLLSTSPSTRTFAESIWGGGRTAAVRLQQINSWADAQAKLAEVGLTDNGYLLLQATVTEVV